MNDMKKLIAMMTLTLLIFGAVVPTYAEDINPFPPQRPEVGIMTVDIGNSGQIAAVRTNGTVNILYGNDTEEMLSQLSGINNAVDIAISFYRMVAVLKSDGTVAVVNLDQTEDRVRAANEVASWTDIVAIESGRDHFVGLKADGTVVAAGRNDSGQCNVFGWNNVSEIVTGKASTIAIKKDGTLMMAGSLPDVNLLRKEKDVKKLFLADTSSMISSDEYLAIKSDGSISGNAVNTDLNHIIQLLKDAGVGNIVDMGMSGASVTLYVLDDQHRLWSCYEYSDSVKLLEEDVYSFHGCYYFGYFAIDNNGQIVSDKMAFTSDDWILTTNITYNGNKINSDVPPYVKDGRTLAPMRAILEALGMNVSWDGATQTATAVKANINISISINSNIAVVNGEQQTLDVPAEITNGRTFVPVRFFAEALNMDVDWDAYTKTVIINSK